MKMVFKPLLRKLVSCLIVFLGLFFLNSLNSKGAYWTMISSSYAPAAMVSSPNSLFSSPLPLASQGARIDESRITKTLYVDNTFSLSASTASGSQEQPFTSIQQALNTAKVDILSGTGVRVIIKPGTYREELYLEGNGGDNAPLIIESAEPDKVIISGADVFTDWQPVQDTPGIYEHVWTHNWGTVENHWRKLFGQGKESAYPDFRREMFYLDGKPLSQKLSRVDLRPGSFFVDEAADRVFLWTPPEVDINSVLSESAMRSENQDFAVLKIHKLNNFALKDLTITQGSVAIWGSTRLDGKNILIEDCNFDRNNGVGLSVEGEQITIRRTTANENGHGGMLLDGASVLLEQSEASWNGWKMKEWGYEDNSAAGVKFGDSHNVLARNLKFVGNSYPGLWFDVWCTDVTVDNVLALANDSAGFNWEISDNLKVSRLYSVYNQLGWLSYDGSRVQLEDSVIAFNRSAQVLTENTTRKYDNELWTVRRTTIAADVGNQYLLWDTFAHSGGGAVGPNNTMDQFAATFTASNNVYFHPSFAAGFRQGDGSTLSFGQWQNYTKGEVGSVWDQASVESTKNSLKITIQNQWGEITPNALGYHDRPQLPW
jgi:hypothetical protein